MSNNVDRWLDAVRWDDNGLVAAIAQDHESGRILTVAWMNREALKLTVAENRAVYWSRSRQKIWRKGEESGHVQQLHEIRIDCDADAILLSVTQVGGIACHTGRASCFYRRLRFDQHGNGDWETLDPVLKDPKQIYRS